MKNKITDGSGMVTRIVRIDHRSPTMWYEAVGKGKGQGRSFTHLYRISLGGKNGVSLTPDNGTHSAQLSPHGKYVVDTSRSPTSRPRRRCAMRRREP